MKLKKIIILTIIFSSFGFNLFPTETDSIAKKIEIALRTGNSVDLSRYFNENIQLRINDNTNIYSKKQAEKIITNFFGKNEVTSYEISSHKKRGSSLFIIGILTTQTHSYRMYYRLTEYNNRLYLNSLMMERI